MNILTITAHYPMTAARAFDLACDFDALNRDLGGLVDYHGLPRGKLHEGQSYSYTPVLWTWFRLPKAYVTINKVDPLTHALELTVKHGEHLSTVQTQITPDGEGCIWVERFETTGPPIGRVSDAITRYINKAAHRRRRARRISVHIDRH